MSGDDEGERERGEKIEVTRKNRRVKGDELVGIVIDVKRFKLE